MVLYMATIPLTSNFKLNTTMTKSHPVIIGRAELIDIVGIALELPAKIDTGAFRSSIHAQNIKLVKTEGKEWLRCNLLGHPCSPVMRPLKTDEFRSLVIKNSMGDVETRYEVKLKIKIGPKIFSTSFTLSDRANNIYPILIGRHALKKRFLVDVSQTSINRMALKSLKGIMTPEDEEDLET